MKQVTGTCAKAVSTSAAELAKCARPQSSVVSLSGESARRIVTPPPAQAATASSRLGIAYSLTSMSCMGSIRSSRAAMARRYSLGLRGLRHKLRGIVEERFFRDAFVLPPLIGELLHAGNRPVQPFKAEDPTNHDIVTV